MFMNEFLITVLIGCEIVKQQEEKIKGTDAATECVNLSGKSVSVMT